MRLNNCCNDRCRGGFLVCFGVVLSILFGVLIAVLFALGFIPFITTAVIVAIVTAAIALVILFGGAYISEAGGTHVLRDCLCKLTTWLIIGIFGTIITALIALSIELVPTIPIIVLVGFGAAFFALTLVGLIALLVCLVFDNCCR